MSKRVGSRYRVIHTGKTGSYTPYTFTFSGGSSGAWGTGTPGPIEVITIPEEFSSEMSDVVSKGAWKYNNCEHQSDRTGNVIYVPANGLLYSYEVAIINGSDPAFGASVINGTQARTWDLRNLISRGLAANGVDEFSVPPHTIDSIKPVFSRADLPREVIINRDPFDTDFSIWYTFVDLLDVTKAFKGLLGRENSLRRLRNTHYPKKWTARDLASKNLAIQFGVIPTVSDVQELVHTIKHWKDKYDAAALAVKRHKFHRKVDLRLFPRYAKKVIPFSLPGGAIVHLIVEKETKRQRWHGLTLYGFQCPELGAFSSRFAQIIDSFGLYDPAALWDVIPFSFIIDWFLSTKSILKALKPQLYHATAVLHDYLETVEVITEYRYSLKWVSPASGLPGNYNIIGPWSIGTRTVKSYVRTRFRPLKGQVRLSAPNDALVLFKTNRRFMVDLRRIGISASLIAQRIPR
jgi:hypothetical protein